MRRNLRHRLPALFVLIAGVGLLLAPAAIAKRKPDLLVVHSYLSGKKHYAFAGQTADIKVFDLVKNTGKATAGRSKNELAVYHGSEEFVATRPVGKLDPGEKSSATWTASISIPSNAKLGEYQVQLCADAHNDVSEEDEKNNCADLEQFYIAKKAWTGSFSGSNDQPDSPVEEWSTTDANFKFDHYVDPGQIYYAIQNATMNFKTSGSDGSCTYSGTGIEGNPVGQLILNYSAGNYAAGVGNAPGFSYPVFVNCPSTSYMTQGPKAGDAPLTFTGKPLPFGQATLEGTFTTPSSQPRDYLWNLH